MIAGRSGTQKSGFALWLTANWNLPTLYLSADMTAFQATVRLACMKLSMTTDQVLAEIKAGGQREQNVLDVLATLNFTFSFKSPITWWGLHNEIAAYVELWDAYPKVICIDNLMDLEDCGEDYTAQMQAMSELNALSRTTGATILILHHATDKSLRASSDPFAAPSRSEIKNGMSEKPELCLSVGLNPNNGRYSVACLKQRMGPSNPTGDDPITLRCHAEKTQFSPWTFD